MVTKVFALNALTGSYVFQPMERTRDQWESVHASLGKILGEIKPELDQEKAILALLLKTHQELVSPFSRLAQIQTA
jgi:hypothetical protein